MTGKILHALDKALTYFEDWTLFIAVMGALISLFFSVVLRYGFNYSLAWADELVREVIIYTTFIGCCSAVKSRSMIKIDASVQLVPWLKKPLTLFSHGATLLFSGMMVFYGVKMAAQQATTLQKTTTLQIPMVYLYLVLPLMGVLMFLRTMQVLHADIVSLRGETIPK